MRHPSAVPSRKGVARDGGFVSHWAAKRRLCLSDWPRFEVEDVYEQTRVDLATFRAVPASFTIVCATPGKEKVAKWSSAPASILEGFA